MPAGKGRVGRGSHEEERGQEGGHAGEPWMGRKPHRRGQGWGGGQAGRCQRRDGKVQSSGGKVGTWGRDSGLF